MSDDSEVDADRSCASPPCYMNEVDPIYMGLTQDTTSQERANVMRWRKLERERQIKQRLELSPETRARYGEQIAARLEQAIGDVTGLTVSAYWPFRGEPDLREFLERIAARGGRTALPVVVARGAPLVFQEWRKGDPLERGVWNIPIPASSAPAAVPDVVISPVVGFDPACYRLGYGGGFFDRTLAAARKKPRVFGVGYSQAAIATIYPQPHDIPMDMVVTESGIITPRTTIENA